MPVGLSFSSEQSFTVSGECEGDLSVSLDFGTSAKVSSIVALNGSNGMKVSIEGIKADVKNVPIIGSLSLELDEVDVTNEGIRIYNVPLIGSYEVSFEDLEGDHSDEDSSEDEKCEA